MRGLLVLGALAVAAVVAIAVSPSAGAADDCQPGSATISVAPRRIAFGHQVTLTFHPQFDTTKLVTGSVTFHVKTPSGTKDIGGRKDFLDALFLAPRVGAYSATATWRIACADASVPPVIGKTSAIKFDAIHQTRPKVRFNANVGLGRAGNPAAFTVTTACPAATIASTERLELAIYFQLGSSKLPTRKSPATRTVFPRGCAEPPEPTQLFTDTWGSVQGALIKVLPGNTVRILVEAKSGKGLLGSTRLRFKPSGSGETIVLDKGKCSGKCVKKIGHFTPAP
ncbi:MAG: hypothetical protein QOJ29_3993 [Thermoleophilaceae bacterium]|nr:hypothetical protein [Thermoleophilaceae bacterium]